MLPLSLRRRNIASAVITLTGRPRSGRKLFTEPFVAMRTPKSPAGAWAHENNGLSIFVLTHCEPKASLATSCVCITPRRSRVSTRWLNLNVFGLRSASLRCQFPWIGHFVMNLAVCWRRTLRHHLTHSARRCLSSCYTCFDEDIYRVSMGRESSRKAARVSLHLLQ